MIGGEYIKNHIGLKFENMPPFSIGGGSFVEFHPSHPGPKPLYQKHQNELSIKDEDLEQTNIKSSIRSGFSFF